MALQPVHNRTLHEYILEMQSISTTEFMRRYQTPVLILRQHNGDEEIVRDFKTAVAARSKLNSMQLALDAQALVYPLQKRRDAAFSDHISVGRTRSADVCLNFSEVSKFHAYFREQPGGAITLTDAGATNGTFINGRPLQKSSAVLLENGMVLRFGLCELTYLTAENFCTYVAARGEPGYITLPRRSAPRQA